jgi:phage FluMu protein Com
MSKEEKEVRCGHCGRVLDEPTSIQPHERRPCPDCGATSRQYRIHCEGTVTVYSKLQAKARHGETGRPFLELITGHELSRKLGRWVEKIRLIDREKDHYLEKIVDPDTGEIIRHCEEPLSQHQGHGDARKKQG